MWTNLLFESDEKKEEVQNESICTIFYLLEIAGSHDYHYGVGLMGFIAQLFVKALIPLNKYLMEPIMILTAMKQSIKPFHLP